MKNGCLKQLSLDSSCVRLVGCKIGFLAKTVGMKTIKTPDDEYFPHSEISFVYIFIRKRTRE